MTAGFVLRCFSMLIPFQKTVFIKSAALLSQCMPDIGLEVAFAGRSNAGKSSAINKITGVHKLAKTSKTPGRTQTLNFFSITEDWRLVDLPGYGYANVSKALKVEWDKVLSQYLQSRKSLKGLCLVMDSRHPFQAFDEHVIAWASSAQLNIHLLLSKVDKLTHSEKKKLMQLCQNRFENQLISFQFFSALKNEGIPEARKKISQWFNAMV